LLWSEGSSIWKLLRPKYKLILYLLSPKVCWLHTSKFCFSIKGSQPPQQVLNKIFFFKMSSSVVQAKPKRSIHTQHTQTNSNFGQHAHPLSVRRTRFSFVRYIDNGYACHPNLEHVLCTLRSNWRLHLLPY
jgi:hypothetical protein